MSGPSLPSRRHAPFALLSLLVAAGCASPQATPTPAPTPVTDAAGVMTREMLVPLRPGASPTLDDFHIAPWHYDAVECTNYRVTPSGARMATANYPNLTNAQVTITITADSAGRLVRSSEIHGAFRFHADRADTDRATLERDLHAQQSGIDQTTISLDYLVDPGFLVRNTPGQPMRTMAVSTHAVAELSQLDRPAEHAREAAKACHVGNAGAAAPPAETPEAVARHFFDLLQQQQWDSAAALFTPQTAPDVRRDGVRMLLSWARAGAHTTVNRDASHPTTIYGRYSAADTIVPPEFDSVTVRTPVGVTTLGVLGHMTPAQFLARSLQERYHASIGASYIETTAAVVESDGLADVIFWRNFPNGTGSGNLPRQVLRLRRDDSRWTIDGPGAAISSTEIATAAVNYRPPLGER